jgi:tetratricopeptide (TPR) repeat protein
MRDRSPAAAALLYAIVLACALGAFFPARQFQFVSWDDRDLVTENPLLVPPTIEHLRHFWTDPFMGLYTPLSYTLWWSLIKVSGGADPRVFHAVNIVLHACSAVLVLAILRTCVANDLAAFIGALLFALHPLQVEAVAWVSGMNNLLAAALALAAIRLYLAYAQSTSRRRWMVYALGLLTFALALFAKPTAIVTPLIVLVLDVGFLKRPLRTAIVGIIPWICLAIPFAIIAHVVQPVSNVQSAHHAAVALDAVGFYWSKLLWPAHLTIDYARTPQWVWQNQQWLWTGFSVAIVLLILMLLRGFAGIGLGVAIMIAALLPVLGVIPFDFQRYSTVGDRYMYLAMLGPAVALTWTANRWRSAVPIALLCLAVLAWRSEIQLRHWQDTRQLVNYTLRLDPQSTVGNKILAAELARQGNYADALPYYRAAMIRNPLDGDLHFNYGNALLALGRFGQAMDEFETAIPLLGGELQLRAVNNLAVTRRLNAAGVPSR